MMLMTSMVAAQGANPQRPGRTEMKKMPCHLLNGITERDYAIYLPGSYDEEPLRQYPVLYLMHGGGGSHTDWERANHLSHVTDSLICCGAIDDMIIVCPEGNQQNMMYFNSPTPNSAALGAPDSSVATNAPNHSNSSNSTLRQHGVNRLSMTTIPSSVSAKAATTKSRPGSRSIGR